jgi:hypothetical protein
MKLEVGTSPDSLGFIFNLNVDQEIELPLIIVLLSLALVMILAGLSICVLSAIKKRK